MNTLCTPFIRRLAFRLVLLLGLPLLWAGCSVTPNANVGLDLDYYNGKFHVRPTASIGVTGRP